MKSYELKKPQLKLGYFWFSSFNKNEVVSMQNRLKREGEIFQMHCKDLTVAESKINSTAQQNNAEMVDINERLSDAKRKYNDIKLMFLAAYNEAKNPAPKTSQKQGPAPALEEGENEDQNESIKEKEEKIKKKKKKKKVEKKSEGTETDDNKEKSSTKKKKKSEKSSKSGSTQNTTKSTT